jgi:hypothetical protein
LSPNGEELSSDVEIATPYLWIMGHEHRLVVWQQRPAQRLLGEEKRVSISTINHSRPPIAGPDKARQRAIELCVTTDMKAGAIATEVGVTRATVLNWLRTERGTEPSYAVDPARGYRTKLDAENADVAELRRDLSTLIAKVGRLEKLLEALTGLQEPVA